MKCVINNKIGDTWYYYDNTKTSPIASLHKINNSYAVIMLLTGDKFDFDPSMAYKDLISEIRRRRVTQLESIWISDLEDKGYSEFEINLMIQDRINEYLNHN